MWCQDHLNQQLRVTGCEAAQLGDEQVQRVYSPTAIRPKSLYLVWLALVTARASSTHMVSSRGKEKHIWYVWESNSKWWLVTFLHLKMAQKVRNSHLVAWLRVNQPIRRENDDDMETKMRLMTSWRVYKGLLPCFSSFPCQQSRTATSTGKNPCHMALANKHVTIFLHRRRSDGTYKLPDYSHEDHNEM